MMGVPKDDLDKIKEKHPETKKRGGIQKYVRELITLSLMDEVSHEEYLGLAKEVAKK